MKIELKAESQLTESERQGLERLSAEAFPPDGEDTQWARSDWHVLVWEGEEIVSHVEIVERTAAVGGRPVRLGGIGGVSTLKAWRRRGLAEAALKVAVETLHRPLKVDFGLLVCGEVMIPYYSKFGWKLLGRPMWIEDQPGGRVLYKAPLMILPVGRDEWPDGEIDLCGRPW
ncbi:MAG TPA: GNAT family N-acetyltransferase [Anaerolineales bacterium]|nr:GNAT family N-acetyltransferase [Anaerolineales bacterium]